MAKPAGIQDAPNPRALSWNEFIELPCDSPIIIDNDSLFDVPGHFYLFALASLGKVDLRGIVVAPAADGAIDRKRLDAQMKDVQSKVDLARDAGMTGVPDAVRGSFELDYMPSPSLTIEDTQVVRTSAGSELIVREAQRAAAAGKKLVVAVGGHAATVALAYLTDSSIADHVIVFGVDFNGANGQHEWASWIISKRMKLAHYSPQNNFPNPDSDKRSAGQWWPQDPETLMPQRQIDAVPNPLMRSELQRVKDRWTDLFDNHPKFLIEGFGDSEGYWVLHAKSVYNGHEFEQVRWIRPGHYVVYDPQPDPIQAELLNVSIDHTRAIDAFFSVLQNPAVYHPR